MMLVREGGEVPVAKKFYHTKNYRRVTTGFRTRENSLRGAFDFFVCECGTMKQMKNDIFGRGILPEGVCYI